MGSSPPRSSTPTRTPAAWEAALAEIATLVAAAGVSLDVIDVGGGFPVRYGGSYALLRLRRKGHRSACLRIPMEIEADWVARRTAPAERDVSVPEIAARR